MADEIYAVSSGTEGQLIPVHLNACRGNGQIYHANCHCGRDNMLNAAKAVSISLFRHTREVWPPGNVTSPLLVSIHQAYRSSVPQAESATRAAFLIPRKEGDANFDYL